MYQTMYVYGYIQDFTNEHYGNRPPFGENQHDLRIRAFQILNRAKKHKQRRHLHEHLSYQDVRYFHHEN